MKIHPALLMLIVWGTVTAAFLILPFRLESRVMMLNGFLLLMAFIGSFCAGALLAGRPRGQRMLSSEVSIDFRLTDRILMAAGIVAVFVSLMELSSRNIFDLAAAYETRSERAGALMAGAASDSSIWFQIAFLFYPACYAILVREIAFRPRPVAWRIGLLGLLPIVLTALAIGGRAPLFYAFIILLFAWLLRRRISEMSPVVSKASKRSRLTRLHPLAKLSISIVGVGLSIYIVQVFAARADVAGGIDAMFGIAARSWGVSFNGTFSSLFYSLLGVDGTYMVFVSAWYLVQGLVISNTIFTGYDGPMMFGTYGIDLFSAVMRRWNSDFVADGFFVLTQMNVYGFLPSAFGSLYVDFKLFALPICFGWGWLAGRVYARIHEARDPRWLFLAPVVTVGIVFSLINTPIGFSNGLITHFWMLIGFFALRLVRTPATVRSGASSSVRPASAP